MKKLLCVTSLMSTALCAHAQSSVTLYGIINTGFMYVHNSSGSSTQFTTTSFSSRWGVQGSEDLGGGVKTIFQLESGFNATTGVLGNGGREFGRRALVGLSSTGVGAVTLGRQLDPLVDLVTPLQGNNLIGIFTSPGDVDNADNSARFSNSVKWLSPNWGGLKAAAMYAVGGVAGSIGNGQSYAAALAYNGGSLGLATGYLHIDNGTASLRGSASSTSTSDSLFLSDVNRAYTSAKAIDIARISGNYQIGAVTVGAYGSYSDYKPDASSAFKRAEKYKVGSVFAGWQVSAPLTTQIGYVYMKSNGASSATYNTFAIQADYFLSKRTDVYTFAGYTHASGSNGLGAADAVVGSLDRNSGKSSQAVVDVGIRHKF
jgi:predicted porin